MQMSSSITSIMLMAQLAASIFSGVLRVSLLCLWKVT